MKRYVGTVPGGPWKSISALSNGPTWRFVADSTAATANVSSRSIEKYVRRTTAPMSTGVFVFAARAWAGFSVSSPPSTRVPPSSRTSVVDSTVPGARDTASYSARSEASLGPGSVNWTS
jgi:hypothetical protein